MPKLPRIEAKRLLRDERIAFLQGFLRRPGQVASVVPSSRFLERRLVSLADVKRARLVVELGPGTGGTTRAILAALPADARLLCIELDPDFARLLKRETDPRLIVHEGSAEHLPDILAAHGLSAPDVVISGIPFSVIPAAIGTRIVESIRAVLAPGGCFVAYQVRGAVADRATPLLGEPDVTLELLNIPPLRVLRWHVGGPARAPQASAASDRISLRA
ncbi:MAG: methyltransferase domain-containing protein [Deltaproteobacteria bacterium]|nr:methyltransferase domain-containing protein [Deltaproteobacteria bacterium]